MCAPVGPLGQQVARAAVRELAAGHVDHRRAPAASATLTGAVGGARVGHQQLQLGVDAAGARTASSVSRQQRPAVQHRDGHGDVRLIGPGARSRPGARNGRVSRHDQAGRASSCAVSRATSSASWASRPSRASLASAPGCAGRRSSRWARSCASSVPAMTADLAQLDVRVLAAQGDAGRARARGPARAPWSGRASSAPAAVARRQRRPRPAPPRSASCAGRAAGPPGSAAQQRHELVVAELARRGTRSRTRYWPASGWRSAAGRPAARTRASSSRARSASWTCSMVSKLTTRSNASSSNGSAPTSPAWTSTPWRSRAWSTVGLVHVHAVTASAPAAASIALP